MSDDEGKAAKGDRTSENLGAPPTQGDGPRKLVDFSTESFLLINVSVKEGQVPTRAQLIQAIDEALEETPTIPFFSDHRRTPEGEVKQEAQPSASSGGPGQNEGLLMLVRQEGY
jgi:hypothetical protein